MPLEPLVLEILQELNGLLARDQALNAIANLRASEQMRRRVEELIESSKQGELSSGERVSLDCVLQIEHLLRVIKARHFAGTP
jgi:hypothetical protein